MTKLSVPIAKYILDQVTAKDLIDQSTGEVAIPCNTVITEGVTEQLLELGVGEFQTIYTNDWIAGRLYQIRCE